MHVRTDSIADTEVLWGLSAADDAMAELPDLKDVIFAVGNEKENYEHFHFKTQVAAHFPALVSRGVLH